jgi:hypothetical protein
MLSHAFNPNDRLPWRVEYPYPGSSNIGIVFQVNNSFCIFISLEPAQEILSIEHFMEQNLDLENNSRFLRSGDLEAGRVGRL